MRSLITAWETVKFGPVDANYPTSSVCNHIKTVERTIFNTSYLGLDFYEALEAGLTDTSVATKYDSGVTYSIGDLVYHEGLVFQSLKDVNTVNIDNDNDLDPSWKIAPKFVSDTYNVLWDEYMKYWIAIEIIYRSIRYNTYKATAKGVMKTIEDNTGAGTIDYREFSAYKKELQKDSADALESMMTWMVRVSKAGTYDFTSIDVISENCGVGSTMDKVKARRRKRFYFKN